MRFTSVLVAGILAVAAGAQDSTSSAAAAVPTSDVTNEIVECLKKCDPADNACRAPCIAVPNPSPEQADSTTKCVAECDKGTGTESDIQNFTQCYLGCIGTHYFTSGGIPQATGGSGSGSGSGSESGSPTKSGSSSPSGSGGAATGSSTPGAAAGLAAGSMGFMGLVAAIFAL